LGHVLDRQHPFQMTSECAGHRHGHMLTLEWLQLDP
jgi:hypothetical protein